MSAESPLVVQVNIKNVLELGFSSRLRVGAEKRNLKNLQKSYRSNEIAIRLGIYIIFLTSGWLRNGVKMYLFVRKNKDDKESKEFYYLGRIHHEPDGLLEEFVMPNTDVSAVEIEYKLKTPVEKNLYDYLTSENV